MWIPKRKWEELERKVSTLEKEHSEDGYITVAGMRMKKEVWEQIVAEQDKRKLQPALTQEELKEKIANGERIWL